MQIDFDNTFFEKLIVVFIFIIVDNRNVNKTNRFQDDETKQIKMTFENFLCRDLKDMRVIRYILKRVRKLGELILIFIL